MEGHLGKATPTTSWHQLHWWKSPRWIVVRIEALGVVAIIISFLLAAFGSCRRWSNSWIVQKGFFVAQVLSLSLGTYTIGLMQSSSVKSEMYSIWTVSLFVLFGCIDPVTTYNSLDYKGPLSKVVYGICLNCGYVLLMSISSISNFIGNAAIITLSAISFIKGFHRSFALVQQNRMRDMVYALDNAHQDARIIRKDAPRSLGDMRYMITVDLETSISQYDMQASIRKNKDKRLRSCYDVCVALCLSHRLHNHILGLDYRVPRPETLNGIDYRWALKVIEIELAFLYDIFFTGNPFLHYYQAKTAGLWALASFTGICFVLVTTAIPGGMARRSRASGCTKVVDTTATDLAITFGILVALALLQLAQLVRSWTSNWARAAVAYAYARKKAEENRRVLFGDSRGKRRRKEAEENRWALPERHSRGTYKLSGWMRLKVLVATSTNMFDKNLWILVDEEGGTKTRDHRRVANALSMYCAYLVKSAPELLPGPVSWTKRVYDSFVSRARGIEACDMATILERMAEDGIVRKNWNAEDSGGPSDRLDHRFRSGGALAKLLMRRSDTWEMLALVWVQLLVYAAPYGNAEEHMRRLSQGGEFITHIWALLYHLDIREWKVDEENNLHNISTVEDAQRILNDDDHDHDVVVFFASPDRLQQYHDPFVTASRPIDGVRFYLTSSPDVATFLKFPEASILVGIGLLFLNRTEAKFTFFNSQGDCATYDFAHFVYENKLASARARAQEATPSALHNPISINKQGPEDGHSVAEIEEEIPTSPPSS